jgi:hypothetical protein
VEIRGWQQVYAYSGNLSGKCALLRSKEESSFDILHCFNIVMLAKQIYIKILLVVPESICAQVLRAQNHLSGDLIKAGLNKGSLFFWKSLKAEMESLKREYICQVGFSANINVWSEPWLTSLHGKCS